MTSGKRRAARGRAAPRSRAADGKAGWSRASDVRAANSRAVRRVVCKAVPRHAPHRSLLTAHVSITRPAPADRARPRAPVRRQPGGLGVRLAGHSGRPAPRPPGLQHHRPRPGLRVPACRCTPEPAQPGAAWGVHAHRGLLPAPVRAPQPQIRRHPRPGETNV